MTMFCRCIVVELLLFSVLDVAGSSVAEAESHFTRLSEDAVSDARGRGDAAHSHGHFKGEQIINPEKYVLKAVVDTKRRKEIHSRKRPKLARRKNKVPSLVETRRTKIGAKEKQDTFMEHPSRVTGSGTSGKHPAFGSRRAGKKRDAGQQAAKSKGAQARKPKKTEAVDNAEIKLKKKEEKAAEAKMHVTETKEALKKKLEEAKEDFKEARTRLKKAIMAKKKARCNNGKGWTTAGKQIKKAKADAKLAVAKEKQVKKETGPVLKIVEKKYRLAKRAVHSAKETLKIEVSKTKQKAKKQKAKADAAKKKK